MILDSQGNPMKGKKPIQREIAVSTIYDKYSTYPSNGLTPQKLAAIFKEADVGSVYRQMELFEEMEGKDPHLFSQMQTRKNAVIGLDFEVLPFSDDERDKEISEFISDAIYNLESIEDIFIDLLDAIGKGFAVSEIMWEVRDNKVQIKDIVSKHQKKFLWDEWDVMKVTTEDEPMGIPLPNNKFIIHKYKARSGHPAKAGVLRVIAWMYLFKNYDVKDWVSFCEVFGMPLRLGKYNSGTSEEDKDALIKALVMLGSDAAGIIPESTDIEFVEASKTTSINVYEALANFCNKEMSKAILGQTLTSEIGSSGSFAASKTHDGVRQDLIEADCKALAQTLRRDLIRPLVLFNFGIEDRLPHIKFHSEPPEDLEKSAKTYSVLIKDVGLPVAEEHIYEKFGIPKPEAGQKVLAPVGGIPLKNNTETHIIANKVAKNKVSNASKEFQKDIDGLSDEATNKSTKLFKEMFETIRKLMDESDTLEDIKRKLEDPKEVQELLKSDELEELLQKVMFAADVLGRMREDAEHS
jgi:phage gp29-like protein